mmetsp:Transcript_12186/g.27797  ORF Transcript_12186/g.27797 Transcript_12186/m.27797 type:complete len:352 (-) Transcript_12186:172-1227(-)
MQLQKVHHQRHDAGGICYSMVHRHMQVGDILSRRLPRCLPGLQHQDRDGGRIFEAARARPHPGRMAHVCLGGEAVPLEVRNLLFQRSPLAGRPTWWPHPDAWPSHQKALCGTIEETAPGAGSEEGAQRRDDRCRRIAKVRHGFVSGSPVGRGAQASVATNEGTASHAHGPLLRHFIQANEPAHRGLPEARDGKHRPMGGAVLSGLTARGNDRRFAHRPGCRLTEGLKLLQRGAARHIAGSEVQAELPAQGAHKSDDLERLQARQWGGRSGGGDAGAALQHPTYRCSSSGGRLGGRQAGGHPVTCALTRRARLGNADLVVRKVHLVDDRPPAPTAHVGDRAAARAWRWCGPR